MTETPNYYNRSIDLCIYQGIEPGKRVTVDQSLLNQGGSVCTGIQKLIQRWVLRFLTPIGSVKFHPEWGTSFLENAISFNSEIDAQLAFYSANADACSQLRAEETDDMDLDERIDEVTLNYITLTETGFSLGVTLTTLFGTTTPVVLPILINPLPL